MIPLYVYGIIRSGEERAFDLRGVDDVSRVQAVVQDGLACLASEDLRPGAEALPPEKLFVRVLTHRRVLEQVARKQAVLPVAFGTHLVSPAEARLVLSLGHANLGHVLAYMEDKVEMDLSVAWVHPGAGRGAAG